MNPPADDPAGSEAWIGSVTRVGNPPPEAPHKGCSEVILPDGQRMFLFEAINLAPEEVLGKKHISLHGTDNLGMLIKYLDAQKQYTLQAHPTRAWAKKMWNSDFGKEESWYVIGTRDDTAEPAYILLGFKEGVTREQFDALYRKDDLPALEKLCHKIQVKTGETYFVGGGVPHALGEGCFVIEVQEPSDITVVPISQKRRYEMIKAILPKGQEPRFLREDDKLYDERMLGSFFYDGCNEAENFRRWRIPNKTIRSGDWGSEYFIIGPDQTSFFSYTRLDVKGRVPLRNTGFPQVAIILEGEGSFRFEGGILPLRRGDEVFLPWNIPGAELEGTVSAVLCHPEGANR
ncbi:mannose-6-phosphate isomerase [Spirochaetia bacterium]|nr:mannose-6-phosphate isomerase [Spirochaetia bacterium]